jgi:hypothetical protein
MRGEGKIGSASEAEIVLSMPEGDLAKRLEKDGEEMLAKHELPDGTAGIYAQYLTGYDGATMDETVATLEANGATEIERCTLNGLDAVSFSVPDVNAVYVVFITQSGNYVQFIFSPASDEGFASVAQLVTASIRPETEG